MIRFIAIFNQMSSTHWVLLLCHCVLKATSTFYVPENEFELSMFQIRLKKNPLNIISSLILTQNDTIYKHVVRFIHYATPGKNLYSKYISNIVQISNTLQGQVITAI